MEPSGKNPPDPHMIPSNLKHITHVVITAMEPEMKGHNEAVQGKSNRGSYITVEQ